MKKIFIILIPILFISINSKFILFSQSQQKSTFFAAEVIKNNISFSKNSSETNFPTISQISTTENNNATGSSNNSIIFSANSNNYSTTNTTNNNKDSTIQSPKLHQVTKSGEGKEFWLCFMTNFDASASIKHANIDLQLFITGDHDATVTIEFEKVGYKEVIQVKGGEVVAVKMDKLAQISSFAQIEPDQAIHIVSTEPITVYGLNRRSQTTDTFLGYPIEVLGTEYMIMSYFAFHDRLVSLFAIVATEDNTEVIITPSTPTLDGKPAGKTYTITMNRGDVYQCGGLVRPRDPQRADLTGTSMKSNKKIAVFSGHQCANIPSVEILACNHLVEQMPPIQTWGKHFYIGNLKLRSRYTYRVLAAYDSTRVFQDTSLLAVLNKGEFVEKEVRTNIQITANKPILVAQYSQSLGTGDGVGDPMMILVSPTQQFLKKYRFATPVNGLWHHFINIMVPTRAISSLQINGTPVDKNSFEQMGVSKFSVASVRLPYGSHTVECSQPFGLYSYGFGSGGEDLYDAYGTMGGQSFVDYVPAIDSISPAADLLAHSRKKVLLLSDDGSDDTGLSSAELILSENIKVKIPSFVKSAPSIFVDFDVVNKTEAGRLILRVQDVAMNEIYYTICYVFDNTSSEYIYKLNKGKAECTSTKSIQLGAFLSHSYNFYNSDFNITNNIHSSTNFEGLTGKSGILGIGLSRNLFGKIGASAKLILNTNRANFSSIDTIKKFVQDSISGNYTSYFEGKSIEIKNTSLSFDLGIDYKLSSYFYFSGGASFSFNINKKANCEEKIYFPPGFVYEENSVSRKISNELSSLNGINFGMYLGPGLICNIEQGLSVFSELNYYYFPFSQLKDANLFLTQMNFKFGIKYSL